MKTVKAWAVIAAARDEVWRTPDLLSPLFVYPSRRAAYKAKKQTWISRVVRVEIHELKPKKGKS